MSRYGSSQFSSLLKDCVLWAPLSHSSVTNTAKAITANGNVTQVTTIPDPWGMSRPVAYFDGSGDYLTVPASTSFDLSGDFCIECYLNMTTLAEIGLLFGGTFNDDTSFFVYINTSYYLCFYTSSYTRITGSTALTTNTYYHICLVRTGNNISLYLNGNLQGTYTSSQNFSYFTTNSFYIGYRPWLPEPYIHGYMSEFRISNIARYTSNFTPPSTRFKPDVYTKLLLHMYGSGSTFTDDPFVDIDEFPIIPSGVTVTNYGTWTKDDLGNNKSVLKFDGSTNYVQTAANAAFNFGTGDFTICFWCYFGSTGNYAFVSQFTADNTNGWFVAYVAGTLRFATSLGDNDILISMNRSVGVWYHIAIVRSGTTLTMYQNMVPIGSASLTQSRGLDTAPIYIGSEVARNNNLYLNGNIKDLMIYKGRALTQPEIKLLMNRTHPITGRGLIDSGRYWRLT